MKTVERVQSMPTLPPREADAHKGKFGSVLIVAGGRGMAGAAALCGGACIRSGAGLVRVACAAEVQPTVASFEPSYMTYPIPNDESGFLRFGSARSAVEKFLPHTDVLAVGPGLGESDDIRRLVTWFIESVEHPIVLDADGLNALVGQTGCLQGAHRPVVLTPHPGEFARLVGKTAVEVQANREEEAVALARSAENLVVVLKGAGTVVTDGKRIYVNNTGNPGMATGGVGDALTGVIAALIAQGLPAFEAAQLGVYVHGLAGDIARDQNGMIGLIAGDLVDSLPDAFYHLMG